MQHIKLKHGSGLNSENLHISIVFPSCLQCLNSNRSAAMFFFHKLLPKFTRQGEVVTTVRKVHSLQTLFSRMAESRLVLSADLSIQNFSLIWWKFLWLLIYFQIRLSKIASSCQMKKILWYYTDCLLGATFTNTKWDLTLGSEIGTEFGGFEASVINADLALWISSDARLNFTCWNGAASAVRCGSCR